MNERTKKVSSISYDFILNDRKNEKMLKNQGFLKVFFIFWKISQNIDKNLFFSGHPQHFFLVKIGVKLMISWIKQTQCKSECYSVLQNW